LLLGDDSLPSLIEPNAFLQEERAASWTRDEPLLQTPWLLV